MENVLKYFEFGDFIDDKSNTFSGEIAFSELNSEHFMVFEKVGEQYDLYLTKYRNKNEIGKLAPEIFELLVKNYDKSKPEHRIAI